MFDVIESLKTEWTDKYVVVSSPAPELARFSRTTGIVRTVNMNGRCLVEFDQFNNTAWYDIDPACLKIVPKPEPKPVEKVSKTAHVESLETDLKKKLATRVEIRLKEKEKGQIVINFENNDDFERILQVLNR